MIDGNMKAAIKNSQILAGYVDRLLNGDGPRTVGFALIFFPTGVVEGARANYVSNCDRKDMVVSLKEVLARWEGQPETKGGVQ